MEVSMGQKPSINGGFRGTKAIHKWRFSWENHWTSAGVFASIPCVIVRWWFQNWTRSKAIKNRTDSMAAGPRWPSVCIGYTSYFIIFPDPAILAVDEGQTMDSLDFFQFPFFRSSPLITKVAKPQRVFTKPWGENCRNLRNVSSAMALIKGSCRRPILALERESDSHHLKLTPRSQSCIPRCYMMYIL